MRDRNDRVGKRKKHEKKDRRKKKKKKLPCAHENHHPGQTQQAGVHSITDDHMCVCLPEPRSKLIRHENMSHIDSNMADTKTTKSTNTKR